MATQNRASATAGATTREVRRIVLTHWNAGVFHSEMLPEILPELIIYALLYDEVLIREEDLLTNRQIMRLLAQPGNLDFFCELLLAGLVRILRLPPEAYPPGRRFDPTRLPISARVEEHWLRRTYKGKPWRPTRAEWNVINRLDQIISQKQTWKEQVRFPATNTFAERLATILENREAYALPSHPIFRHVHPAAADAFLRFCREPEEWIRFLYEQGVKDPILGPDGGFYRSAAYQCLALLPHRRTMRRLVESTYAAVYCDREDSDGRYGGSELVELPFRSAAFEGPGDSATLVELVPTNASAAVAVVPGMAEVLIRTRESPAFDALQTSLECLGSVRPEVEKPAEEAFGEMWRGLSEIYANNLARQLARASDVPQRLTSYSIWAYILSRVVGFVALPQGPPNLDWPLLGEAAAIKSIETWGPSLMRGFRAALHAPKLQEPLNHTVRARCSRVTLEPG